MEENYQKKPKTKKEFIPSEIIFQILAKAGNSTLLKSLIVSKEWHLLAQSFFAPSLTIFFKRLKKDGYQSLMDIDVSDLVNYAQEEGSVTSILSKLSQKRYEIKQNEEKVVELEKRKEEKRAIRAEIIVLPPVSYLGGGNYYKIHTKNNPSLFGKVKRALKRKKYENNIEEAKEEQENIVLQLRNTLEFFQNSINSIKIVFLLR